MRTVSSIKPRGPRKIFPRNKRVFRCYLAEFRKRKGLSMREVAEYSGITHSTLCRAEAGLALELKSALALAKFFETSVEELWEAI